jgi:hypothetical protein
MGSEFAVPLGHRTGGHASGVASDSLRTWFATANATLRPTHAGWRSLLRTSALPSLRLWRQILAWHRRPEPADARTPGFHRIDEWRKEKMPWISNAMNEMTAPPHRHGKSRGQSRTYEQPDAGRYSPESQAQWLRTAVDPAAAQLAAQQQTQGREPQDDGGAHALLLLVIRFPAQPSEALQAGPALLQRAPCRSRHSATGRKKRAPGG